jgi:hypothetical protein
VWWFVPVISALRRLRQEDEEFEVNLAKREKKKKNSGQFPRYAV